MEIEIVKIIFAVWFIIGLYGTMVTDSILDGFVGTTLGMLLGYLIYYFGVL